MTKNILEVLYQCDDNYATLTGVSMLSLMENNKDISEININLLDDGISKENLDKTRELVLSYGRKLNVIETKEIKDELIKLNVEPYKGTYTTYYKIVTLGNIKTKADRILYLDGDTIINKSLLPLLSIDLTNSVMGASYDCLQNDYKKIIGLNPKDTYYNCGVMLVNKNEWNNQGCDRQILDHFINKRSKYFIVDQDVINVLFHDKIKLISPTYNLNSGFYIYGVEPSYKIYDLKEEYYYSTDCIKNVIKEGPVINHCMGGFTGRPWEQKNIHPQNDLYDKYLSLSPWKDEPKIMKKLISTFKTQRLLYKILPRSVYGKIHRFSLQRYYMREDGALKEE